MTEMHELRSILRTEKIDPGAGEEWKRERVKDDSGLGIGD